MPKNPPEPGIYHDVPFGEYLDWQCMSNSILRAGSRSMRHLKAAQNSTRESTPSQILGQAEHTAVLEPDQFPRQFIVRPERFVNTKGKEIKLIDKGEGADYLANLRRNHTLLSEDDYRRCIGMRDAVRSHPAAMILLGGKIEVSIVWLDEETGVLCKARLDVLPADRAYIADLKTTRDGSPGGFPREVARYGYHRQAAFYLDGLAALGKPAEAFCIIAVENFPPYAVCVYTLDTQAVSVGQWEYRKALAAYAETCVSGEYPGYPMTPQMLSLPHWAIPEDDEEQAA
jgi:hypothetical protein